MENPFIMLAPMEGVVDSVTRALYSEIGGFDRFVTEFVRVTDRPVPPAVFYRYCPELLTNGQTAEGVPVYVQLLGGNAEVLAENAAVVAKLGAPGIDFNFGCPAPTVNRHDGGATLLKNPHRLFDVLSAARRAVPAHIPITAKVRLGFSNKESILEIAKAVDESGASMLTVHARTRDEGYKPPAHWEFIAKMREVVKVPVVANGDIWSVEDYKKCREVSGCERVALGRGAMAVPDLALQIRAHLLMEKYDCLDWADVQSKLLPKFIRASTDYKSPYFALTRSKQWLRQLTRGYPKAVEVFDQVKWMKSTDEIFELFGR